MPSSNVVWDIDGPLGTLTFARPEAKNALTWEMYDALVEACDARRRSRACACSSYEVPAGAFSAGTDISQFAGLTTGADGVAYERRIGAVIDRLERVDHGHDRLDGRTGRGRRLRDRGGVRPAARAPTPPRFGVPVARTLGNCLSVENLARLVDLIGAGRAADMLMTGRLVSADQALEWGLATRVSPVGELDADTLALALRSWPRRASSTIIATKAMLRRLRAHRRPPAGACDDLIAACYASAEFREGVAAFAAKRAPAELFA